MRISTISVPLLLLAFVAPAIHAGSPSSPEATDPSGDAFAGATYLAALDITSAWFTTGNFHPLAAPSPQITIQVADLGAAAPAADAKNEDVRYHYRVDFVDAGGVTRWTECVIALAPAPGVTLTAQSGLSAGVYCEGATPTHFAATIDPVADRVSMWLNGGAFVSNVQISTWSGPATAVLGPGVRGPGPVDVAFSSDYVLGS